jgi:hypothetical protein
VPGSPRADSGDGVCGEAFGVTLLGKAKASVLNRRNHANEQEVELALAWARGDVTTGQAGMALIGRPSGSAVYCRIALGLRKAIETGLLQETKK